MADTTVTKKLIAWLAQEYAALKAPVDAVLNEHLRGYYVLVLENHRYSADEFMRLFPTSANALMGMFRSSLPADDPLRAESDLARAQESITAPPRTVALVEGAALFRHEKENRMNNEALVKRIEQIINEGVPRGVKLPQSVARYLTLVELKHLYTPAAYFAESALVGNLVEDVAQLEIEVSLAHLNRSVAVAADRLTEAEATPSAPDWNAILHSYDTFAAWRRGER